jgi:hypothetical protein
MEKSQGGQTAHGLAIDIPFTCPANGEAVRVFGYAITDTTIFGIGGGRGLWNQVAGDADQGQLGGMATMVRCSA